MEVRTTRFATLFDYWGTLEGFEPGDAGTVTRNKIITTLTATGSPR